MLGPLIFLGRLGDSIMDTSFGVNGPSDSRTAHTFVYVS